MSALNKLQRFARQTRQILYPIPALGRRYLRSVARRYAGTLPDGAICVDLGAGTAPFRSLVREHFRIRTYVALDIAPSESGNLVGDMTQVPLASECTHLLLAMETLQHVEGSAEALDEIARILAPGGIVIVSFPFIFGECDVRDFRRWTMEGMANELTFRGLDILETRRRGGSIFALASFLHWGVQHIIPGARKSWRLQPSGWNIVRAVLVQFLAIPTAILSWIALGLDALLPASGFYSGGYVLARRKSTGSGG